MLSWKHGAPQLSGGIIAAGLLGFKKKKESHIFVSIQAHVRLQRIVYLILLVIYNNHELLVVKL